MTMTTRTPSNLLALAVLALLAESPMHPYEMDMVMRSRGLTEGIKLRRSSLYTVIESLQRSGLIEPVETQREGKRPERTVYAITEAGRAKFAGWHRELLRTPAKEYPQFMAGLTFLAHLRPEETVALLEARARALAAIIDDWQERLKVVQERMGVPRLFLIEAEYAIAMGNAELAWIRATIREIQEGTLAWPTFILDAMAPATENAIEMQAEEGGQQEID
jgi:DNA-binding PadR family transcriptional regulator